jgi:serine/threonine-protein kinase
VDPEIVLATVETPREFARILRAAMRYAVAWIPLDFPPIPGAQHLLVLELEGTEHSVTLQGELAGDARGGAYPLRLKTMSAAQTAQLFVLCESIDVPSDSLPPSSTRRGAGSEAPMSGPSSSSSAAMTRLLDNLRAPNAPNLAFGDTPTIVGADGGAPPSPRGTNTPRPGERKRMSVAPPTAAEGDPLLGRTLAAKYRIESIVGAGTFGAVYKATHVDLGRPLAVKVLHAHAQREAQFVERFRREAVAASKIDHPNVTRIADFGHEPDGLMYLVMEFVAGESLEHLVATQGRLPQRRVLRIGAQVCSALVAAHDEGVIHRDIKPENILLVPAIDDDEQAYDLAKVCDFGTAKMRASGGKELTTAGMLCGSPAYMSPEQGRAEPIDYRTDIYALGVTLYEAVTGRLPFDADTLVQLLMAVATTEPRKPSAVIADIHPQLEALLLRMLSKDPAQRPQSARALRKAMRGVLFALGG